jgi:hypothetical protein
MTIRRCWGIDEVHHLPVQNDSVSLLRWLECFVHSHQRVKRNTILECHDCPVVQLAQVDNVNCWAVDTTADSLVVQEATVAQGSWLRQQELLLCDHDPHYPSAHSLWNQSASCQTSRQSALNTNCSWPSINGQTTQGYRWP